MRGAWEANSMRSSRQTLLRARPRAAAGDEALKLRERAYRSFTRHLLARDIRPGQFVSQRELVALTGLPLGAIRELVPRLEAEGLIVTVPQRGMQVAHVDLNLVRNAFQFRLILEREAVAAFTREASDEAIAAQRDAHLAIIERARKRIDNALIADAQHVDSAFHEALIDHLGNEIISNAYRVNWIKLRLIRQAETRLYDNLVEPAMREHLAVIDAIAQRDENGAVAALTRHVNNARNRAMRIAPFEGASQGRN
jgi:DNA-binding GntR family transcriptional regulator